MTRKEDIAAKDADNRLQASTARQGAEAKGGVDPQPGDPTSPKAAARRAGKRIAEMDADGFGDHKGGRL